MVGLISITMEETRKAKEKALKTTRPSGKTMDEAKPSETI